MKQTTSKKAERWRKKLTGSGVDLDMNPMVDMAFLLLTFFMLTTTLTRPFALELIMPAEEDATADQEKPAIKASRVLVLIPYRSDTVLYYQGLPDTDLKVLHMANAVAAEDFFERFKSSVSDPVVFVKPTDDAPYEIVVTTIDQLNNQELNRYALDQLNEAEVHLIRRYEATRRS